MKKIFSLAVILSVLIFAGMMMAKPAPAPAPMMAHCPRIHAAVRALDDAIAELKAAGHDFCGHKEEGLRAAEEARRQLHDAEGCANCK